MINVKSGGRTRIAGIVAALFLLLFIVAASPLIEQIPLAALVGVMFMVVIGTFAWNTFKLLNKVPLADVLVMVTVTSMTVAYDLAIAVFAGVIMSALVFSWEHATRISVTSFTDEKGIKHYEVFGPLFFGATTSFLAQFDIASDPDEVIIDFAESRISDQSAIEAINKLANRYQAAGKELHLRHLSSDCIALIQRAEKICDINVMEDPSYFVAVENYKLALSRAMSEKGSDELSGEFDALSNTQADQLAVAGKALRRSVTK